MAKPICVIKIDSNTDLGNGKNISSEYGSVSKAMSDALPDYHVIVVPTQYEYDPEPIKLQVFHEKDFTEIEYQELKQLITDSLKQNTHGKG
jgi:hypothetical protein